VDFNQNEDVEVETEAVFLEQQTQLPWMQTPKTLNQEDSIRLENPQ
jgi:hypothetical protein